MPLRYDLSGQELVNLTCPFGQLRRRFRLGDLTALALGSDFVGEPRQLVPHMGSRATCWNKLLQAILPGFQPLRERNPGLLDSLGKMEMPQAGKPVTQQLATS